MRTRTLIASAALAVMATVSVDAQSSRPRIGLLGGVSSATFKITDPGVTTEVDRRTGFLGGGFLTLPLGRGSVRLEPEVLYVQKGAEDPDKAAALEVDYLEVPVLFGVGLGREGGAVRLVLYAGPALSFETKCTAVASSGGVTVSIDCDEDSELDRTKTDVSAVGGARLEIQLSGAALLFGARHTMGFTLLTDAATSTKNRAWGFYAGVGVPLGG